MQDSQPATRAAGVPATGEPPHASSHDQPGFWGLAVKTIVVHTVTYFVMGLLAAVSLDYGRRFADPSLSLLMRQLDDPWVMAGPLFQPLRGLLFAVAFYLLRHCLFGRKGGWLVMWLVLVIAGILSTFGPAPGSIEGAVYTTLPWWTHVFGLPEVIVQAGLLSAILVYWVDHPGIKWLGWLLGAAFVLCLVFPLLGLLFG
jgi:hypothetical protein